MTKIKLGTKAPALDIPDQNGIVRSLKDEKGKWVLLYFYPKDNTPGCTLEARDIRDKIKDFKKLNCTVFGISTDSVESHKKFAEKQKLPFTLLADTEKRVVQKYGVWQKKKFIGKEYMGIVRSSFLVDTLGNIAKIYPNVNPVRHIKQVIDDLKVLTS